MLKLSNSVFIPQNHEMTYLSKMGINKLVTQLKPYETVEIRKKIIMKAFERKLKRIVRV